MTAEAKESELIQLFSSIGLTEQKAKETLKNPSVTTNLKEAIEEVSRIDISIC